MADVINIVSKRSYKVELEGELRLSEFNLFHSINDDGQKRIEEKLFLTLIWKITKYWLFLVRNELLFEGIKSNKYFGPIL